VTEAHHKLLDCTLRDGGYYNDWDFSETLVSKYLQAMGQAGVPVVELGFRFLEPAGYAGPTAHTTDDYIDGLDVPANIELGVMLNAKDLVTFTGGPSAAVDKLFRRADRSRVDLVRIASTWNEIDALRPSVDRLIELGYEVGVNLMQVHARSAGELTDFGGWSKEVGAKVAYFADSFGGLYPTDIGPIAKAIAEGFDGPIGCHLHDNMSLAIANTIAALNEGVSWVDSTIRGMGRGPGNARTEYLAVELTRLGLLQLDVQPLLELVTDDFAVLQNEYGWGTNLFYALSASHGVHPTYVQNMIADPRYSAEDILASIEELGRAGGASFSMDRAIEATATAAGASKGTWDATSWCEGRNVLIIGPGSSVVERRADIERYIERCKPLVVNLNLTPLVDPAIIDTYVVCNPMRAKLDRRHLSDDSTPIVAPETVGQMISSWQPNRGIHDYGFSVDGKSFTIDQSQCTLPNGLVAAYALAVVTQGGAKEIHLVGLDGFDPSDSRQGQMVEVLERFAEVHAAPPVVALTPTSYPVTASSLYAPDAS
jgi:4-hydroxy 2-oxovalerate aldolase